MNLLGIEPSIVLKYRGTARRHLLATLYAVNLLRGRQDMDPAVDDILFLLDRPHDLPWELEDEQRTYKYELACDLTGDKSWRLSVHDSWERLAMAVMGATLVRHWDYELGAFVRLRNCFPMAKESLHFELGPVGPGLAPDVSLILHEASAGQGLAPWSEVRHRLAECVPYLELPDSIAGDVSVRSLHAQLTHHGLLALQLAFVDPGSAALPESAPVEVVAMAKRLDPCFEGYESPLTWYLRLSCDQGPVSRLGARFLRPGKVHLAGDAEPPHKAWQCLADLSELSGVSSEFFALRAALIGADIRVAPTRFVVGVDGGQPACCLAAYDFGNS
jgi:hypothetical protein